MDTINWLGAVTDAVSADIPNLWVEWHSEVVCFALGDHGVVLSVVSGTGMIIRSTRSRGASLRDNVDHGPVATIAVLDATVPEAARRIVTHLTSNVIAFADARGRRDRRHA